MGRGIAAGIALGASTAFVACFIKPDRPSGSIGDGGTMDAVPRDGGAKLDAPSDALSGCGVHDDFDDPSGLPCGSWGTADTPSALSRTSDALAVGPITVGASAHCETTNLFNFSVGASVEIVLALASSMGDQTFVSVTTPNGAMVGIRIVDEGTGSGSNTTTTTPMLVMECDSVGQSVLGPYIAQTHRWVRFSSKVDTAGPTIVIETSPTAAEWTLLSQCMIGETPSAVRMRMGATRGSAESNAVALFDNFNIKTCPPL